MNRDLAQCIVESLRVTGPTDEAVARLCDFKFKHWQQTLSWLDDSGLVLRLLNRISHSSSGHTVPPEIQIRLQSNLAVNQFRVAQMKEEFRSLNLRFAEAGVRYAVLKGFALIPDFCPRADWRVQYDYDFLVHPGSLSTAQDVLRAAGYSQKVKCPGYEPTGETSFFAGPLSLPTPDQDYYSANIPRGVELHLDLWQPERDGIALESPPGVLDRIRIMNWEGVTFPVLAEEDALLFQALHTFSHILAYWCRLSCFLEIAYFIEQRHADQRFWECFVSRIQGHRYMPEIVGLVFTMAERLFGAPIPAPVRAATTIRLPRILSLWVQRFGSNWALSPFPGSKLSLIVHREFVDDPVVWKAVAWSRIFPFHRPARVAEPGSESPKSHWKARWQHGRHVLGRLRFHLGALLSLGWGWFGWNRVG